MAQAVPAVPTCGMPHGGLHLTPLARPLTWARLWQAVSVPKVVSLFTPPAAQVMLTLGGPQSQSTARLKTITILLVV